MNVAESPAGTVIAVAPTGTASEFASAAADCERVGAAIIDVGWRPDLGEVIDAIRRNSGLLIRVSAHGADSSDAVASSGADIALCPLSASANLIAELRGRIPLHYEANAVDELDKLREWGIESPHVVLVHGGRGGMTADVPTLAAAMGRLPRGTTFCATGLATAAVPIMMAALAAGGHIRAGLADSADYAANVPARDSAQLVARAAGLAKLAQRPPISPSRATRVVLTPTCD